MVFGLLILFISGIIAGLVIPRIIRFYYGIKDIQQYVIDGKGSYMGYEVSIVDLEHGDDEGNRYPVTIDGKFIGFCKSYSGSLRWAKEYIDNIEDYK